jgi:hypothetical protein
MEMCGEVGPTAPESAMIERSCQGVFGPAYWRSQDLGTLPGVVVAVKRQPVAFAIERWMRMPGIATGVPTASPADLFVFSGYADFTGGSDDSGDIKGPLEGTGFSDTNNQATWVEYDIEEVVVGPHWRSIEGVCPMVVIGGHSQVSPDEADAMGFRVQGISKIDTKSYVGGGKRIRLSVSLAVRGGLDGKVLTLAYQVSAWGRLLPKMGAEGVFFPGEALDAT